MTLYRVTLRNICAGVVVNQLNIITESAPILNKFKNQHISRLRKWVEKQKGAVCLVSSWERE